MIDESTVEVTYEELEAAHAKSYAEVFAEGSFMDEAELDVLITKEEIEAKAQWADLHAMQAEYPAARAFLKDNDIVCIPSADNRVGSLEGKLSQLRKDGKARFKDAENVTPLRANEG